MEAYESSPTIDNGRGYWLKFDGSQVVTVTGDLVTQDTVDVVAGWNMVGSIGVAIPAATIGSIPGGLVSSAFFEFSNGYNAAPNLVPGKGYWVKVAGAGQLVFSSTGNVPVTSRLRMELEDADPPAPPGGMEDGARTPEGFTLDQNYPNPFNPTTTIRYAIPSAGQVTLTVFNMIGQEVAVLVNEVQDEGYKTVSFDASNLPSGVYTYRITAGTFSDVKKMLLVR